MLEVKNLTAGYPGKTVLREISFAAGKGEITAVIGPNGCGKSTLLKAICGICRTQSGEICWDGRELGQQKDKERARTVAYLAQSRQVPDITVEQMVLHGRFPHLGYPRRYSPRDREITRQAIARMGLEALAGESLQKLSGGQRQKAYLAMALAQDAPVLLLDEPTTYLDIRHQLQILQEARRLREEGRTVVMVLHDLNQAMQTADRLVLLEKGRLVCQGTPEAVFPQISLVFGVQLHKADTPTGVQYYY